MPKKAAGPSPGKGGLSLVDLPDGANGDDDAIPNDGDPELAHDGLTPAKKTAAQKKAAKQKAAPAKKKTPDVDDIDVFAGEALSELEDHLNVLYLGAWGSGKTTASAAMANLGKVLYINAESGIKRGPLGRLGIPVENVVVLPPKGVPLTYEYLDRLFWKLLDELQDGNPNNIVGVVWDSVTDMHRTILRNVVDKAVAKAEFKGVERDEFFTDLSEWGVMTEQMRLLIRRYRDLPCHFVMTALTRRDKDDDGKVVYRPAVSKALSQDLGGFMDIVCVCSVAEVGNDDEYQGLFKPVGKYEGKDRFGIIPKRLVDPRFDRLVAYVREEIELESDPIMQEAKDRRIQLGKLKGEKMIDAEVEDPDVDDDEDDDE